MTTPLPSDRQKWSLRLASKMQGKCWSTFQAGMSCRQPASYWALPLAARQALLAPGLVGSQQGQPRAPNPRCKLSTKSQPGAEHLLLQWQAWPSMHSACPVLSGPQFPLLQSKGPGVFLWLGCRGQSLSFEAPYRTREGGSWFVIKKKKNGAVKTNGKLPLSSAREPDI